MYEANHFSGLRSYSNNHFCRKLKEQNYDIEKLLTFRFNTFMNIHCLQYLDGILEIYIVLLDNIRLFYQGF